MCTSPEPSIIVAVPVAVGQFSAKTARGNTRHTTFSAAPVFENGCAVGVEGFLIDDTDRRLAERNVLESLREKEALLREVHHRVRNNLNVVMSLLRLHANSLRESHPAFMALGEAETRIRSMALVHSLIYESDSFAAIRIDEYLKRLASEVVRFGVVDTNVELEFDLDEVSVPLNQCVPLGLVVNEALTNVLKHAFDHIHPGSILVGYRRDDGSDRLTVKDNGVGIAPADLEEARRTGSLGLTLIQELARQLGGRADFRSRGGLEVSVVFPNSEAPPGS